MLVNEQDRKKFMQVLQKEALTAEFGEDEKDIRYEIHVMHNYAMEWEHLNIVCLERKDNFLSPHFADNFVVDSILR